MENTGHSKKYELVIKYYKSFRPDGSRLWSDEMVKNAVIKKWITKEEYHGITGGEYEE